MVEVIISVFLISLAILLSGLNRAYREVSAKELARRSREGDEHAHRLHQVAKYGSEVGLVFWPIIIVSVSLAAVLLDGSINSFASLAINIFVLAVVFIYLPRVPSSRYLVYVAEKSARRLAIIFAWLDPLNRKLVNRVKTRDATTNIYSKEDLRELLVSQRESKDNRIEDSTLDMMIHILRSSGRSCSSLTIPLDSTKVVSDKESIGPILINELHQTKQSFFPVKKGTKKEIIGTFFIGDLLDQADGGKVKDVTTHKLFYINESQGIESVLDAFSKSKSHVYMVLNEDQKIKGVITVEDVIKQLLGPSFVTYFDSYESPEQVANTSQTDEEQV